MSSGMIKWKERSLSGIDIRLLRCNYQTQSLFLLHKKLNYLLLHKQFLQVTNWEEYPHFNKLMEGGRKM